MHVHIYHNSAHYMIISWLLASLFHLSLGDYLALNVYMVLVFTSSLSNVTNL